MKNKSIILFLILLFSFLIFSHIESLTIRLWDEGRNSTNVIEMLQDGFSLVTTYNHNPDHWNTKPPLLIWLQFFSIKILGYNEFAFRLPTALACLAFIPLFLQFFKRLKFGILESSVSLLVFITIPMTLKVHTFKTGDFDGLLTMFMASYLIYFYLYLREQKVRDLMLFSICFIGAAITKGIAGLLFLPAMLVLTIWEGKIIEIFKTKEIYISILAFIGVIATYYLGRELLGPGYLAAVYENELGGRFGAAAESHSGPWYFYFEFLQTEGLGKYAHIVLISLFGFLSKKYRQLAIFSFIVISSHMLVISLAETKLYWYALPQIPFFGISIGLGILGFTDLLFRKELNKWKLLIIVPILAFFTYRQVLNVVRITDYPWEHEMFAMSRFIRDHNNDLETLNNIMCLHKFNPDQTRFYVEQNNKKGGNMKIADYKTLDPGDRAMVIHDEVREAILDLYILEEERSFGPDYKGKIYKVISRKF